MYKDKILLITGGTGSFGNAILSQLINSDLSEIRIFSRDEKKQEDMRIKLNNKKVQFYIGDVRDFKSINSAMNGVNYVFHAAALKQVPSCEFYPMEAVKTNILGAENVLEAAYQNNVENVIVLSTDKAVYPINAMGLSKSMMEKLMLAKSRESSLNNTYSATRYGNVMGSRGSVIPLFISQIKSGKPLTITDPNMTRFMMNIDESVDLVNFAFENANPGDIFVQKSPAATLETLVEALLHIFDANNEVQIIGTRHSEKLYETLLTREEVQRAEDLGDYFRVPSDNRDLNYAQYFTKGEVKTAILDDYHSHNTERLNLDGMIKKLINLDVVQRELNNDKKN
jgi:UDP-N-acetylglucosamine 4,6-dehydratase/5-epimerase